MTTRFSKKRTMFQTETSREKLIGGICRMLFAPDNQQARAQLLYKLAPFISHAGSQIVPEVKSRRKLVQRMPLIGSR